MNGNFEYLYKCNLLSETQWISIADELYKVANILEPQISEIWEKAPQEGINFTFIAIYFMLVSYATENYLKAIIIGKEKERYKILLENKCELPSELKSHDLPALAKKAGFNDLEPGLLRRLSRCAKWYGRYPVPVKGEEFPYEKYPKEIKGLTIGFTNYDVRMIKKIIEEIKRSIQ